MQQSGITGRKQPGRSLDRCPLVRAVARCEERGSRRFWPVSGGDIESGQRRGRIDDNLVQRSLRVVGAARRQWSLGWVDPPLNGLTDLDRHEAETGGTGDRGFALFERGEVEVGRATQWGKGSRYRKSEEPPFVLGVQQCLQGLIQCRGLQRVQAQGTGWVDHVKGDIATQNRPHS